MALGGRENDLRGRGFKVGEYGNGLNTFKACNLKGLIAIGGRNGVGECKYLFTIQDVTPGSCLAPLERPLLAI